MTLIEIFEKNNFLFLNPSRTRRQKIPQREVKKVGEEFHIYYPKEFNLYEDAIKKEARKRGIFPRRYNAYTHKLDDTLSPIQARIQLYHIPEKIAHEEEKRRNEEALDGLWDMDGSADPNLYK